MHYGDTLYSIIHHKLSASYNGYLFNSYEEKKEIYSTCTFMIVRIIIYDTKATRMIMLINSILLLPSNHLIPILIVLEKYKQLLLEILLIKFSI